jgi:hypothetical protein
MSPARTDIGFAPRPGRTIGADRRKPVAAPSAAPITVTWRA